MKDASLSAGPRAPDAAGTVRGQGHSEGRANSRQTRRHDPGGNGAPGKRHWESLRAAAAGDLLTTPIRPPTGGALTESQALRSWTGPGGCRGQGFEGHLGGDPMLGTRGGCSQPLGWDPTPQLAQGDARPPRRRRPLTCTLAARQVHQLQPGAHLPRGPGGALGQGPRGPGRGSAGSTRPPPCCWRGR